MSSPGSWRSRGYIPHFDGAKIQSLTWRLADSYPKELQRKVEAELKSLELIHDKFELEKRKKGQQILDAGYGDCHLRRSEIAAIVEESLLFFNSQRYELCAWTIMPNHVHVLVELFKNYPLSKILHTWRSFTAKKINEVLERTGEFWAREPWDRYIRDARHYGFAENYIDMNPVKAGLCKRPEDWPFGSARFRER